MMANYTLRQLKYFVTTAKCRSVTEASRKLYIAQPSISGAIKNLEDSFGVQLFIRHHAQGVSLTPSGSRFYRKAQKLLRMAHIFEQDALADNDTRAKKHIFVVGDPAVWHDKRFFNDVAKKLPLHSPITETQ
ncbi:HTH-type transcriptional regulator tfdS [Serratia quinivorans]|nr:HTH-type transcriptional regulator tfdS [Serratia quinivorans]CAI1765668.1 HTH-type transcriptional regulator tfdS [Serratia quinivorans]